MRVYWIACLTAIVIAIGAVLVLSTVQKPAGTAFVGDGARVSPRWSFREVITRAKPAPQNVSMVVPDSGNALAEDPYTFAFLESTAKGAGTYAHKLWRRQVAMAEMAEWHPLFIPWFFDKEHFVAPQKGWRLDQPSTDLKERIGRDWRGGHLER